MKSYEQLINNIIGQLNGVKKMIDADKKCLDVLIQMKAVKSATSSLTVKFIEENMTTCMSDIPNDKKEYIKKLLTELTKLT